ncbi:MAG: OPT/YSL family transporter [Myxococcales bacterium]|nr:OPT/YSL family transporter [Myxococcales bacterium]
MDDETPSYPPVNTSAPQLTLRAVLTGMILGGILSLTNIYAGLKIGWGFNMSVTAMLVSFGLYRVAEQAGVRRWGMLENNINQTGASAAASISSAGLVAPIPALTILTGQELSYPLLVAWTFTVSLVGVMVAIGLRRQMLLQDKLPFPYGVASAETIKQMYAEGREAMKRVLALAGGAAMGAAMKLASFLGEWHAVGLPFSFRAGAASGVGRFTFANLGFSLDPSFLMIGAGMIIGLRAGASMLLGVIVAWGWLAPMAVDSGWVVIPAAMHEPDKLWFGPINQWMLWPGVAMMVTSALTSFAFSWRSVLAAIRGTRGGASAEGPDPHDVPRRVLIAGLVVAGVAAVLGQILFFGVTWWIAILAVLLTFFLAIVAGRVSGETGITPVGPMGKVTQLTFGVLSPENVAGNLMAANVTGGAGSQCGDMLHDLKTGLTIGASPRHQALAQVFGVLAGALAGCAGYLVLIPDPAGMLLTDEWPAPAVAAWKGVAELFRDGIEGLPPHAIEAMLIGGGLGVVLAILEKVLPKKIRTWVPSPAAVGIAIVVPAYYAISMFLGGVIGAVLHRVKPEWAKRYVIIIGAGLIAGESVVGVGIAIYRTLAG